MASDKQIDKITTEIEQINKHLAQCRMNEQKLDHDKLITTESTISTINQTLIDFKKENKEQHDLMINDRLILADKLEQVSGNLNQSMIYIKDLQNGAKIRVGLATTIISGVIATTVAAGIIYIGTVVFGEFKKEHQDQKSTKILIDISKQIKQNSEQLQRFEKTIQNDIKSEE